MVDRILAEKTKHKRQNTIPETLQKPAKRTKATIKVKTQELLEAINPINRRKELKKIEQKKLDLQASSIALDKQIKLIKEQIQLKQELIES